MKKNYFLSFLLLFICGFISNQAQASMLINIDKPYFSCDAVSQITVPMVSTTTATINWYSENAGNSWDIAVGLSTDTDPTSLTFINSTTTSLEVIDLIPGTQYKVWVRSVCEIGGNGDWVGPVTFKTDCLPITNFNENFDTIDTPNLPNCWSKILRGESISVGANIKTVNYNAVSAPNCIEITNWGSTGTYDIILVSPNLANLSAGTHRLRFTSKGEATLDIGTVNTATPSGVFTLYEEIISTNETTEYAINFDLYEGTDTHIAIRLASSVANNYIFLDNFIWEEIPACSDVTQIIATSTTSNSANFVWTPAGSETSWDVAIGATSVTDPNTLIYENVQYENTSEESFFIADNLETLTTYKIWVRSICEEGNGAWIGPVLFTTDCESTSNFNETFASAVAPALPACWSKILRGPGLSSGAKVETSSDIIISGQNSVNLATVGSSGEFDIILISPHLSSLSQGSHRLRFFAKFAGVVEVGTLNSNTNAAVFNLIESVTTINGLTEYIVDFSNYSGTDSYIGFRIPTPTPLYTGISLDNIVWEPIPDCPEITEVNVPIVTENTAIIDWISTPIESSWQIVYGTTLVTDPNMLTPIDALESPFEIIDLSNSTAYNVWVRTVCENSYGEWIGPVVFKTECPAVETFIQNFDSETAPAIPFCWSKILRGANLSQFAYINTGFYNTTEFPNFTSPNYIQMNAQGSEPTADIILVSPKVSTLANGSHRLKFDSFYPGSLQIGTLDGNTNTATFTPIQTVESGGFIGASHVINFDVYSGSNTYIGIRLVPDTNIFPSVNIDNIIWEPIPNCPDVTNISITNTSQTNATVTWTQGGNEESWEVVVGESSISDPNTLTAQTTSENTLMVNELTASTNYKVWVRSICTGENGAWIGPVAFLTPCIATDVPYVEDFQNVTVPALPSCTTSEVTYAGSNNWVSNNGASNYGFPTKALRYYDSMDNANAWFFTRAINLVEGQNYTISYKKGTNSNFSWMGANLKVMYGTSPFSASMTTTLANHVDFYGNGVIENITFTVPQSGIYYFSFNVYSNAYASSVFVDDITIQTSLATGDFTMDQFNYYPNPVYDVLTISNNENINSVVIYNVIGQEVLTKTLNANEAKIDLSSLAKGTYIAKVSSNSIIKTIKVIKN